ncbi:hypothetical protein AMAG_00090 [Allomyces macrogynus ATCC 38327]|uniref:F-box domain-containing protein n=1 Tax=Allomyces macrogynus (strain ATCC 38327) TaxID=578462 RepID=A0A0L0RUY6_ALLM3|nr:hypothetical protein AMAG_00090 [Allomyces macrogynus ATCC 38327]|eukprot:KNE54088.1 hypothetical protein AMAG_00090 [Allomyces macrogynus ATCC 38327]
MSDAEAANPMRAPIERLPSEVIEIICRFLLCQHGRAALVQFSIAAAAFFAPAIRVALLEPPLDPPGTEIVDAVFPGDKVERARWWAACAKRPGELIVCAEADADLAAVDEQQLRRTFCLFLTMRAHNRKLVTSRPAESLSVDLLSFKWSFIQVPTQQVRHVAFSEDVVRRMPLPAQLPLPSTLTMLHVDGLNLGDPPVVSKVMTLLPTTLTTLVLGAVVANCDWTLKNLYDRLPLTLKAFTLINHRIGEVPEDFGHESTPALLDALAKMTALTRFHHEILRVEDASVILDALAAHHGRRMRLISLSLLVTENTNMNAIGPTDSGLDAPLIVDDLDVRVTSLDDSVHGSISMACMHYLLPLLPNPTRSLRLESPQWNVLLFVRIGDLMRASPTLTHMHLQATDMLPCLAQFNPWSNFPFSALIEDFFPSMLTSLSLTKCLPGRFACEFSSPDWSFPSMITEIDLSCNELVTADLEFLKTRWPPGLVSLNLAHNKIDALVVPLPDTMQVLDLSHNRALGKDTQLNDESLRNEWILGMPSGLRELSMVGCRLDESRVGLLRTLQQRAGTTKGGYARLRIRADEGQFLD